MKTVQDKDGNTIQVSDDTPCHGGINGALPVMLDATLDADIFTEMAARDAVYDAAAPERAIAKVIAARMANYGSAGEQLEFIAENGIDAFLARQAQIKLNHPKGE